MIVLDTNVLSELMRPTPDRAVVDWVDAVPADELATTAVTAAELLYGVARLPTGRRRSRLADAVGAVLEVDFRGRVLPFDLLAAVEYAEVVRAREASARPVGVADAQIAAICRLLGASLATRNVADFTGTGVEVVDPWN